MMPGRKNSEAGPSPFGLLAAILVAGLFALPADAGQASPDAPQAIPAFPGAEGYGAQSVGGRGGRIIEVTNLNDSGEGSFRAAVGAAGKRIVVFRVGGVIELRSRVEIQNPHLTIAGQTAPGGGITLKGTPAGGGQMLRIRTHDVVIRYLTVRSGAHGKPGRGQVNISIDAVPAQGNRFGNTYNIVLDHVSVSWTLDENIAIHRNVPEDDQAAWKTWPRIYNLTVQHCLIAEGLYPHSTGLQTGGERVMRGGKQIYNGGHGVEHLSVHRNVFANTSHRNPGLGCKSVQVVNNVMYNWGSKCAETHDAIAADWVGNYFKPGPLSEPERLIVHNDFFKGFRQHRFEPPSIFMKGNVNAAHPRQADAEMYRIHYEDKPLPDNFWRRQPLPPARFAITVQPAEEMYKVLLDDAGNNARLDGMGRWVKRRDDTDKRILQDVRDGTGGGSRKSGNRTHYTHPDEVGGYPAIAAGTPYADTDRDGMPDEWERLHGLDPERPDGNLDADGDGYTNVEEFLNGTKPR